jgi:hypothetical protein
MPWPLLSYTRVLSLLGFKFAVSVREDDLDAHFARGGLYDCLLPDSWLLVAINAHPVR